jgi:hypothetical protein
MQYRGNIRKMRSKLGEPIQYKLPLYQVLDPALEVDMNALLGKEVRIVFEGGIHCVVTGKKIKKTFGDGMSYEAFMESPQASPKHHSARVEQNTRRHRHTRLRLGG